MAVIKVGAFGGMVPAVDDRLLPETAAVLSQNTFLYSGALVPLPQPKELHTLTNAAAAKVFRLPAAYSNSEYLYDSVWMEFEDPNTDVVRAPVFGETFDRYYWASSNAAPKYNTRARIENSDPEFLLGVTTPTVEPTVSPSGGVSSTMVTRAYVYTWVTAYGEESAPSPPQTVTGRIDDTWNITLTAPAADDVDGPDRDIDTVRIYRTITSASGVATFFYVTEQVQSDTSYADSESDDVISANSQLESTNWTPPPSDLQGMVVLPTGSVVGWRENEVWFSEPYRPHAWPAAYVQTLEYPIVGLGVIGQTLVVCTQGYPVTMTGSHPSFMAPAKLTNFEPCSSRGSILSTPEGVYYASPNGLVLVNPGRAENITREMITKDKWQTLTKVSRMRAARLGTAYYAFGSIAAGVFEESAWDPGWIELEDFTGAYAGVIIDPRAPRVAFNLLSSDDPVTAVGNDPWSGELLMIRGGKVLWLDQVSTDTEPELAIWTSKVFQTSDRRNLAACRIYFEDVNGTPDTDFGTFKLYADGRLVYTRELDRSGELFRLPSGFKADFWQFSLEVKVRVLSVQLATSVKELRLA